MIQILNFVIDGIEQAEYNVRIKEKEPNKDYNFDVIDFIIKNQEISSEAELKKILGYPFVIKDEVKICETKQINLQGGKSHFVHGNYEGAADNTPVNISWSDQPIKNLKDTAKMSAVTNNGIFQFLEPLEFDQDTTITVWTELRLAPGALNKFHVYSSESGVGKITFIKQDNVQPPIQFEYNGGYVFQNIEDVWKKDEYSQAVLLTTHDFSAEGDSFAKILVCANSLIYDNTNLSLIISGESQIYQDVNQNWVNIERPDGQPITSITMQKKVVSQESSEGLIWSNLEISGLEGIESSAYTTEPEVYSPANGFNITVTGQRIVNDFSNVKMSLCLVKYNQEDETADYESFNEVSDEKIKRQIQCKNVNKGISDLENNRYIEDSNYDIFYSSLTLLSEVVEFNTQDTDYTYRLLKKWGNREDNNRIIVWTNSSIGNYNNITIETLDWSEAGDECLTGDTLITMSDGTNKRLDCLKKGDLVLSEQGITKVLEIRRNIFTDYHIQYLFEDGTIIDEAHDHRFYNKTQGFWQRLKLWNIGDAAINKDGKEIRLIDKIKVEEVVENFGLFTESGSYYANGLLSGEAWRNRELLAEASLDTAAEMILSIDEKHMLELLGVKELLI